METGKDIPPVKFATNDASAIRRYLIETLGYKDGNIIFHTNTSKAALEMIFGTKSNHRGMLYNYIKPQKSDVFIYYSGHGAPDPSTNKAYLVPTDCNPTMMDLTAYPLDVLLKTSSNTIIFTSAENDQVSSWYPEKQHSMFTYFFMKAVTGDADFDGDSKITLNEIYNFVTDRTEGVPYSELYLT